MPVMDEKEVALRASRSNELFIQLLKSTIRCWSYPGLTQVGLQAFWFEHNSTPFSSCLRTHTFSCIPHIYNEKLASMSFSFLFFTSNANCAFLFVIFQRLSNGDFSFRVDKLKLNKTTKCTWT